MKKATLVVISGLPGTGKSTLAEAIAKRTQLPIFSVDPIEAAMLDAGIEHDFESGLAAYLVAAALAEGRLRLGQSAIIDAVSSVRYAKRMWQRLAGRHVARLRIIECVCSDEALHRKRLTRRRRRLSVGEPTWADVLHRQTEWVPWTEPSLVLDSAHPPRSNVQRALKWLGIRQR